MAKQRLKVIIELTQMCKVYSEIQTIYRCILVTMGSILGQIDPSDQDQRMDQVDLIRLVRSDERNELQNNR